MEDRFVGAKGLASSAASVVTSVVDVLEKAVKDGDILSYRNIVVRIESSVVYVDYQVAPVEPNNYILITSHFVPESISATL
ncbi:hypothetical protein D3C81_2241640 [compost metagenome]